MRDTQWHELKIWPEYFMWLLVGKNFEVRKNDRDFVVGDYLILKEYNPKLEEYTGRQLTFMISYMFEGGKFGIEEGYVVMGLQ